MAGPAPLPSLPVKGAGILWYERQARTGRLRLLMQQFLVGPGAGTAWWDFGGKRHAGERSLATACRECMEEMDGVGGDAASIRQALEAGWREGRVLVLHDAATQSYAVYVAPFPSHASPDAAVRGLAPETDGKPRRVAWVPWDAMWDAATHTPGRAVMARRIHACTALGRRASRRGRRSRPEAPPCDAATKPLVDLHTFFASL